MREKRFLVTTALEETWSDCEPVLFLGEWCRLFSRKDKWGGMNAVVLPYCWDDRQKMYEDYCYLLGLHERLIADISIHLNRIHGVNYSNRYWRILLGPWLGYFSQIVFERWIHIQRAIMSYELTGTKVLSDIGVLVPNDMSEFARMFISDEWNHCIYNEILQDYTDIPKINVPHATFQFGFLTPPPAATAIQNIKRKALKTISTLMNVVVGKHSAFLLSTYLPHWGSFKVQLSLGQFPQFFREPAAIWVDRVDTGQRDWSVEGTSDSDFERFLRKLIPKQIPKVYLEGYRSLQEQVHRLPWPAEPKIIWTSNSQNGNDVFKLWAAAKTEQGVPLLIGQHGGHYGIGKWNFNEDHDVAIANRYLSWGWKDEARKKIVPLGQLTHQKSGDVDHASMPLMLVVLTSMPRYSYYMLSMFTGSQYKDYVGFIFRFVTYLPDELRKALVVRLMFHDFGCSQKERWQTQFPDVKVDAGITRMNDLIDQSRLYISTYNATTFLQSLTKNIPTVIFWDPELFELRDSAIPFFEELKTVGIFHDSPESAAQHVSMVWNDVNKWWQSKEVQDVKKKFCDQYSFIPQNLVGRIKDVINETIAAQ